MLDANAMRLELDHLSSEAVAQIYDALHDLKDAVIHRVAMDLLWDRHATVGGEWPTREQDIGDPNGEPETSSLGTHTLVAFCSADPLLGARAGRPDNPHRVAGHLAWAYDADLGERDGAVRLRWFEEWQCTCGRRSDHPQRAQRLDLSWRQARPSARVWPVVMRDVPGAGKPIPHFQVCRFARHAEDPLHAPNPTGMQCLCGAYLGFHSGGTPTDKFLPMY